MIESFLKIHDFLISPGMKFLKIGLNHVVQNYSFYHILEKDSLNEEEKQKILENIKKTKVIIIDQSELLNENTNKKYIIIGFEKTLIILEQSSTFLQILFSTNIAMLICFLSNTKAIIEKKIKFENPEIQIDSNFMSEIESLNNCFHIYKTNKTINLFWSQIIPCISGYLIKKSYMKTKKNRIEQFIIDSEMNLTPEIIDENEYVELRCIGIGSLFSCKLIYHIKREELYVIKANHEIDDDISKLAEREENNYLKIMHPFVPKYYGRVKGKDEIVIEFINGKTLENIKQMNLTYIDKLTIIFELTLIIKYLHDNKLIYRDLKPNNVMIDENKTAVLIDFDRLIEDSSSIKTLDFASKLFLAPEIKTGKYSYECDIYSLGKMIEYIINQQKTEINSTSESDKLIFNSKIEEIIKKCTNENPENRPSILDVIEEFSAVFQSKVQIGNYFETFTNHFKNLKFLSLFKKDFSNNPNVQNNLGCLFFGGIYVTRDTNKAIHYFQLASNQNLSFAQCNLGDIYFTKKEITKAIHYLTLAATQNIPKAQFSLGVIYSDKEFNQHDIKKAIYYYSLAADQNIPEAQFNLGLIYYNNENDQFDIKKAIHYLSLAANQNLAIAQFYMGSIYQEGIYVTPNINKAIKYLSLSSNNDCLEAHLRLAYIYYEGKYVKRDISKAIHYFSLATKQDDTESQLMLGLIYFEGNYVARDINKAIYHLTISANKSREAQFMLAQIYYEDRFGKYNINKAIKYLSKAANQNHIDAQYKLGIIYYEGKYVKQDINKAIHYFTLAADQNLSEAQLTLGNIYYEGMNGKYNINKAINYFTMAANQNDLDAQYKLGIIYYEGTHVFRDIKKAILYLSLAANNRYSSIRISNFKIFYDGIEIKPDYKPFIPEINTIEAQFKLGLIYYYGKYVPRDIKKAIQYFSLVAEQRMPAANYNLGVIYYTGQYVPFNIEMAIHYFKLAAKQKDIESQYTLGLIYYEGRYVTRDIYKAIHYYKLAADQNSGKAQFDLGFIYYEGKYIKGDIKKALNYLSLASNNNNSGANYILGIIYLDREAEFDFKKAFHYFQLASKQNVPDAQYILGFIYFEGKYITRDISKAIHYFSLAANKNYSIAQYMLGIIYYSNIFLVKDISKSIYYITLASKNGYKKACFSYGFLLHEGKVVKNDINEAIKYYKEASSFKNQYAKNNLGIIYKHGCDKQVKYRIGNAIEYFKEAIREKNDFLSMYNLALIYIYDETVTKNSEESIELLIRSSNKLILALHLLCLALIDHFGNDTEAIKQKIKMSSYATEELFDKIIFTIASQRLFDKEIFKSKYEEFRNKDVLYDMLLKPVLYSDFQRKKDDVVPSNNPNAKDITSAFYEGFGLDIL